MCNKKCTIKKDILKDVNKFCSKRCEQQVLINYFVDNKMELKGIVVTVKNGSCYKNNKLLAKTICC